MIDLEKFDADELLALARLDVEKERFDEALAKLKQARARQDAPAIISELGRVYVRLGLRQRAKQAFEAVLARDPAAVNDRFQLGLIHFELGDRAQALSLWQEVLGKAPLHPPAIYYSALALAQSGQVLQAYDLCRTLVEKVQPDNLFVGRAKELLQKIESDPKFRKIEAERPLAGATSTTEH